MRNCLQDYWQRVLLGKSYIFAIENKSGARANFEVSHHLVTPVLEQIYGPDNRAPLASLSGVASSWVERKFETLARANAFKPPELRPPSSWLDLWQPFLDKCPDELVSAVPHNSDHIPGTYIPVSGLNW